MTGDIERPRAADATGLSPPASLPPVLYVGDHFGYPSGVAHGVTVYLLNVLPELRKAGLDLNSCFLREPHPAAAPLVAAGMAPTFLSAAPWNPFVVLQVAALARRHGCGLIHAAGLKAVLVARIVARLTGARVVVHVHDQIMPGAALRALHRLFSSATDVGVCVSAATRPVAIEGYHVAPDRVRVAHNGLDLARLHNLPAGTRARVRAALGLGESQPVLTMVGRLYPIKGTLAMVRMMRPIVDARPDARLLLVGEGPDRAACEQLARSLGIAANVLFLGHRGDVPELLAASDLVVMPSQSEGLGLAAIEAQACGRPVVAYAVGGLPEVVTDGLTGRCVAAGDEPAFVAAVLELLGDGERLRRFGAAAATDSARFGLDRHVATLLDCFRFAVGREVR